MMKVMEDRRDKRQGKLIATVHQISLQDDVSKPGEGAQIVAAS